MLEKSNLLIMWTGSLCVLAHYVNFTLHVLVDHGALFHLGILPLVPMVWCLHIMFNMTRYNSRLCKMSIEHYHLGPRIVSEGSRSVLQGPWSEPENGPEGARILSELSVPAVYPGPQKCIWGFQECTEDPRAVLECLKFTCGFQGL